MLLYLILNKSYKSSIYERCLLFQFSVVSMFQSSTIIINNNILLYRVKYLNTTTYSTLTTQEYTVNLAQENSITINNSSIYNNL